MADQSTQLDPSLYDPTYNPTEPLRPWSLQTFVVRLGIALCILWLLWEHIGADYLSNIYQRHGLAAMQEERYGDAAEQFTAMIRVEPSYYMGYELRAQAYEQSGSYPAEIADYTKALELLNPPYVPAGGWAVKAQHQVRMARAHAEDLAQDYTAAIADYTTCAAADNPADALLGRANDYRRTGQYSQALVDFNSALSLRPGDAQTLSGRDDVVRLMRTGR